MVRTNTHHDSPLGCLTLVAVYCPHHWYKPAAATFGSISDEGIADIRRVFTFPFVAHGNELQWRVGDIVAVIPYGETIIYGDIEKTLANETSARDVGQVGRNPLCIVVPCHRVVGRVGRSRGTPVASSGSAFCSTSNREYLARQPDVEWDQDRHEVGP